MPHRNPADPARLGLPARLQALLDLPFPRFSGPEMHRRRAALADAMAERGVDQVVVCGEQKAGTGISWLTGWVTTAEQLVVFSPAERPRMFVEWVNHTPLAREIAFECEVEWSEHRSVEKVVAELQRRGARKVGVMGQLNFGKYRRLAAAFPDVVDMNPDYVKLRRVKSAEELDWLRIGAAFSDASIALLLEELRPGLNERELGDIAERAYTPFGGTTLLHYFGVTSMAAPDCYIPRQHPKNRVVAAGDCVFTEITGQFWDYGGQVLRTFAVGAEPDALYRDLHAAAEAAYDAVTGVIRPGCTMQEIVDASGVIEAAGFTICDDLVHGYGGGYFPPILGTRSRPAGPLPDLVMQEGMTVVVQPNVIDAARHAGVQVGDLVRVTADGCESLHRAPRGFLRVG
ncbi:MAG: M24 family metallopeptidase [Pseudomonadota bacterium]|jgi:Xaa-Pro aminopeptidase